MDAFEQKFSTFVDIVKKNSSIEWSDELVEVLKSAMVEAKFNQNGGVFVHRKKRVNGYNLFLKERMTQLKETDLDSNRRMTQISEEWGKLTDEEKDEWKTKAKDIIYPIEETKLQIKLKKPKKPTKWSSYQIFVQEKMPEIKDQVEPKLRMGEIGKQWKLLTETQKETYKARAEAKNAENEA